MTKDLAIDVVLLPPVEVMRQLIELTSSLPGGPTRLNLDTCLPHISLVMGVLKSSALDDATALLKSIAARHSPRKVILSRTETYKTPDNREFSKLGVETDDLIGLHKDVMDTFRPVLTHANVDSSMFVSPPQVADVSKKWVREYYDKAVAHSFSLHLTLGEGTANQLAAPITFAGSRLALCHLGTYCTCRKILTETRIKDS